MSLSEIKKKGLGHYLVKAGVFSHVFIDSALVVISTALAYWNLLEL